MPRIAEFFSSRPVPRFAVLAFVSVGLAGCSSDTSARFSDNSFANFFSSSQSNAANTTGSAQPPRQLPQYARPSAPAIAAPSPYASQQSVSGGGRGLASYSPSSSPSPVSIETTSAVAPHSVAAAPSGWNCEGGTKIIVGTNDTLDGLSRRYNVPAVAILQANGYSGPRVLQPGQQLIIPRRTAHVEPPALSTAPITKAAAALPTSVHVVNRGDTLMNLARRHHITAAQLAAANNMSPTSHLKIGTKINVPAGKTVASVPAVSETSKSTALAQVPAAKSVTVASLEPVQRAHLATEGNDVAEAQSPVKAADTTSALPTFRWPVRGRVITSYGAKTNGKQNDGINVAVPEGTPIKAAEDGVVTYAGNELKGYGNLILVRHSNGFVTAYAHASELMVKRGDAIKRGQTIAKSGQTGEVGSPQLHFEIRKGSSAVDPLQFLNGA